jgi:hypothetical protein
VRGALMHLNPTRSLRALGENMAKFIRKPPIVEAFRYWLDDRPDWFCDEVTANRITTYETHCDLKVMGGIWRCFVGDYIVRYSDGLIQGFKPEEFLSIYEPLEA